VLVDKDISMERAHLIADKVEKAIKENIPSVIDIVVHLEPFCPKNTEK
jgi:divalent metal cation (Fe/Co/Zn/Cd) transporter